ncbi:MAG: adenylate/guanylate cyclase domain-containing protein [Fimbriimonadaceae bacterium]|nr:adenylate/guanylate cyclase domain-containing protein [Chthonomonadaceae bacterium]MCO5296022.1 adenylate/guanylate cyclase domain-containing protein [Fimbriimonadaceae bacterium]
MEIGLKQPSGELNDDSVQQMLELAERLRESHGGELDDSAIQAVAEATGTPIDYVRLAIRAFPERRKQSLLHRIRTLFLTLEPDVRRYVAAATISANVGLLEVLKTGTGDPTGFLGILQLIGLSFALWNVSVSRDARTAAIAGATSGGVYFAGKSLFAFIGIAFGLKVFGGKEAMLLLPWTLGGAIASVVLHNFVSRFHSKLGIKDPVQERQELLRQLVELQTKLRSGEQMLAFLSADIVGSTKMKEHADPLSVEFTFNEYHQFVEMIARRYGGRVHSTAGDGITCAFDHPQQAFGAGRTIQAGLVELNTFRNKIGIPIQLRVGVHAGEVNAPSRDDIKSVNFAHVIDIAAHLQKVCPIGGVAVSEPAAKMIPGGPAAVGSESVEASGVRALVWLPRQASRSLEAPSEGPPAPPSAAGDSPS